MFRLCTVTGVMVSELRRNNAVSVRNKKVGHCLCRHAVSVCPSVRLSRSCNHWWSVSPDDYPEN